MEVLRFGSELTKVGCDGGGYGCWFWGADGSGVFVNIGRSKRFLNNRELEKWVIDRYQ